MIKFSSKNKTSGLKKKAAESKPAARKSVLKSLLDTIVLVLFFALILRTFIAETFIIPSSSMERTLLIGDYVLVNKLGYGARIPITPFCFPFADHRLPFIGGRSYLDHPSLPYFRLPGFSKIKK